MTLERPTRLAGLVRLGAALAWLGTAHAAWNLRALRRPDPAAATDRRVSVLIPARDEAATIARCLRSMAGQRVDEVLVLDDGSSDGTGALARRVPDGRVRVLDGTPPLPGRPGKPHACRQLAAAATGEVLVFVDADVVLLPGAVAGAVALLDELGADLLSAHPRELAGGVAERLVQPLLQWSLLTFLPLRRAERSPRPSLAAANGQFLLVRRPAYGRCGGHPDAVLDDIALARAVKRSGGRIAWADGSRVAECRMYEGWPGVRDGYGKSLWSAFGGPGGAAAVTGLLAVAYVVPALAALRGSRAGLAGYLGGVLGRALTARRTGGRVADAVAHPLSVAVFDVLTWRSLRRHRQGLLRWRGRAVG